MKAKLFDAVLFGYLFTVAYIVVAQPGEDFLLANMASTGTLSFSFIILGLFSNVTLRKFGISTLGSAIFSDSAEKAKLSEKPWYKSFWGAQLIIAFLVTLVIGAQVTHFSFYELFSPQGFAGAKRIFSSLVTPNLSVLPAGILAIIETIFIAFMATVFAVPAAFVVSFLSAKNIMGNNRLTLSLYFLLRTMFNITRSIEPLIWAIIFSVWVGIGPFAGMLALMLHSVASLAKQYSEIIECIEDGPIEGIQSTGANAFQVIWYAVVPQVVLPFISFTIFRWDINVRMATIIGLVGGGGIGTLLIQYQGQALWHEVGTLALLIVIAVWLMDTASAYIREAIK